MQNEYVGNEPLTESQVAKANRETLKWSWLASTWVFGQLVLHLTPLPTDALINHGQGAQIATGVVFLLYSVVTIGGLIAIDDGVIG